ncbi:MAG: 30S ribosomal protein S3 [Candidatus Lloydbacteria bacterium RIFOXYC12_FULL_46_25]|uniref:Small ribosomal subunit protein uS3 n=1 Tax=Candidatus Lloydbacteria bacterium RIFOXYC12_FULL_46_25 TaxID=1798670 RepID=A0A1G2DTS1_9BACT|nr:MAG: 30S ribosomal protein S3 [Candidatus Lloydbacteria bacterium RIFOXYC12_FULL_46_25]
MSHHVHPYSHRLGILRDWKSRWFADRGQYQAYLKADVLLREFLTKRLRGMHVSDIEMERNDKMWKIVIKTARPGLVIGRNGEGATKLKAEVSSKLARLKLKVPKDFKIEIEEVRNPESNASIVGQMVAEGLEKRMPFKRVIKQMLEKVMANRDVKGARIEVAGRLGGADMSRRESVRAGNIPLQTIRADVDFAREKANLPYGVIGIQVWIYKGEVFAEKQKAGARVGTATHS